jgi:hypothetical protein
MKGSAVMETLEQRKAKYREHMGKAEQFEEDEEFSPAIKHYREALKYSMHKKDTDHIQQKITKLKNLSGYVSGMLAEGREEKPMNKSLIWGIAGLVGVVVVALAVIIMLKPF